MNIVYWPPQNALLTALPEDVRLRLRPELERIQLHVGADLCQPGIPLRELYFPESAVVAISYAMENGSSAEVALVGAEGVVGVRILLGAASLNARAVVQRAGSAIRLPLACLQREMARSGALMQVLLRYTACYIDQIVQTAASNRYGSVEQRLCRWLLLSLDRARASELTMTHESIAAALGVKREGVTEAAGRLRRAGAISYRRGHITVLDRAVLEVRAGECCSNSAGGASDNVFAWATSECPQSQATAPFQVDI